MLQKFIIFWHNLSFKQAVGLVLIFSLFLAVPLTFLVLQREQSIFSLADNEEITSNEIDESLVPYPTEPPQIVYIEKFYGRPGDSILIFGDNFGEVQKESTVLFNSVPISETLVNYWSNNEIEIALPSNTGVYSLSLSVNGEVSNWWGKVNIYDDLTSAKIDIYPAQKLINVTPANYDVSVYSISGDTRVTGTDSFIVNKSSVPIEYASTDFTYIELSQNGSPVPFRVIEH